MNKDRLINSTMLAFLALTTHQATFAAPVTAPSATESSEKCYGIVKTGLNDCATATASCAGSSTRDNQEDAFLFLPKGVCEKIVGGHLDIAKPIPTK